MTEPHVAQCPYKAYNHSDAAKRLRDVYNLHRVADQYGSIRQWIAVRLDDGSTDHQLYPSKVSAIRHQHHNEQFYAFVRIAPTTMNLCEAEIYMATARKMYDSGFRMADPDSKTGGPDLIKRVTWEDTIALSHGHVTNLTMPR